MLKSPGQRIRITLEEIYFKEKHENVSPKDVFDSHKENEKSFSKTIGWIDVTVSDRNECTKHTSRNSKISLDTSYRVGSPCELSPSDNFDGPCMWDKEGLEFIGNVHQVGSYEFSKMNSKAILNNLESYDLEDDDLMIDVDHPENVPLENVECDKTNCFDWLERNV
ncbi:Protein FAM190B [Tupaia chinensis]|uniref:Protein FAM190B n=1 Tax=Tupaia chinensis TaxID=246437 RepID=L9K834_TUPCH|nr:Protein FAM190B [Tupaia chinensis]